MVWVVPAAVPAGSQHGSELGARNGSNIHNWKGAITSQLLVFKNCTSISNEGGESFGTSWCNKLWNWMQLTAYETQHPLSKMVSLCPRRWLEMEKWGKCFTVTHYRCTNTPGCYKDQAPPSVIGSFSGGNRCKPLNQHCNPSSDHSSNILASLKINAVKLE